MIKQAREKKMMELKAEAERRAAAEALGNPLFRDSRTIPMNQIGQRIQAP
jgi:hypothetical protein